MAGPATELGLDRSGNGNNFAVAGTLGSDQMVDTPTNNFCAMNPLSQNVNATLDESNLQQTGANESHGGKEGTFTLPKTGKWYWEVYIKSTDSSRGQGVGIGKAIYRDVNNWGNYSEGMFYMGSEEKYDNAYSSYGANHAAGNIIGVAWNSDDTELTFYHNNSTQGTLDSFNSWISADALVPILLGRNVVWVANFGQDSSFAGNTTAQGNQDSGGIGDFYYTPPSGFLALCTSNLSEPAVAPSKNFNTVLYTGTGSEQDVTGVGFQPDLTWIKERAESEQLVAVDVLRGSGVTEINPNSTAAESDDAQEVKAILSDGFQVGTSSVTNQNNATHVAWNWKAGDSSTNVSESGNNPGGTHRANQAAGISLVTYTGTGSAGTVTHGLGAAPDFIICKTRNNTGDWMVFFGDNTDFLKLNTIAPREDLAAVWNDTSPTSTVFSLGNNSDVNVDGRTYLAWCFKSTDGFSKFGTYIGNGSTDGTFIYTGFRPAFGLFKNITDNNTSWILFDNKRSTFNPADDSLSPDTGYAEEEDYDIDFVSNGFKFRNTSSWANLGDKTYAFVAFAEVPFKYANAR